MKFSYNDLQKYIKKPLPKVEELTRLLSSKSLEVEEISPIDGDYLLEIKILPDRPDCKTNQGLALEVAAIFDLPLIEEFAAITNKDNAKNKIDFTVQEINSILGLDLSEKEIIESLNRFRIGVEVRGEKLRAHTPLDRSDLSIVEDLADEVGRLYGMDKIPAVPLPTMSQSQNENERSPVYELSNKLREIFLNHGYTEVYGFTLVAEGEVKIEKPLASDKAYLRTNLSDGLKEKLQLNLQNIFFDKSPVKIFEIGTVFPAEGKESIHLAVTVGFKSAKFKKSGLPPEIKKWGGKITSDQTSETLEIDLKELETIVDWKTPANLREFINLEVKFKPFSVYPRIFRDIALWVEGDMKSADIADLIRQHAGEFLHEGPILFDEFKKENKTSFAFRMAFQSKDKTLTDEEINKSILEIQKAIKNKGWEVR